MNNNMEEHTIDELNFVEKTLQSELNVAITETVSPQEQSDRYSEIVIHQRNAMTSNDSIQLSGSEKNGKFSDQSFKNKSSRLLINFN